MYKYVLPLMVFSLANYGANAQAEEQPTTAITIYSKAQPGAVDANTYRPVNGQTGYFGAAVPGYAIVRQTRTISLPKKESIINFTDVAALIDPTTVQFKSITDPKGTKVVEQDYQFDLVSQQKLIEKYIDKQISVEKQVGDKTTTLEGTLLSSQGGLTLKAADGSIKAVNGYSGINFPQLPGGLITRPTLVWDIITGTIGEQKAEVSYETKGITWWADYNLVFREGKDANSGTVDFSSWVSIINQTGATFNDAKLKLIAGDVERAQVAGANVGRMMAKEAMMDMAAPAAPAFAEKTFFEYHMYTLNRDVSLPDNSTKQLELIPAVTDVPVEKMLIYNGQQAQYWNNGGIYTDQAYGVDTGNTKVDVFLKLQNKKEVGMGVALPAGRIRVNQRDEDGSLEFIGESIIDHTPRNEDVVIKLGSAFDVVGERTQTNYVLDTNKRFAIEDIQIKIRNQKKQSVKVKVVENLYRATGWQILESNPPHKKESAHQISFMADVDPEKEQIIRYRVKYTW